MILSSFGLFALSWAVIQSRKKEIGIRKVLGASMTDIMNLLTLTFTKRIGLSILLGAPVGYYLMELWLERFANKIELSPGILSITIVLIIVVAIATLIVQTIKAALTNPIDEIKYE